MTFAAVLGVITLIAATPCTTRQCAPPEYGNNSEALPPVVSPGIEATPVVEAKIA